MLQDALQKSKGKHDEIDSTLLEAVRTKEEENKELKTQVADLTKDAKIFSNITEVQEDLRKEFMSLKTEIEEAKRIE